MALSQQDKNLLPSYKVFVGKGNNAMLVRTLFKQRYWWMMHDKEEIEKVNFIWTQCRKQDIIKSLKCKLQGDSPVSNKRKVRFPMITADTKMEHYPLKIYNKLEDNYHLSNKKALFLNMRFYYESLGRDPFIALPITFHIKKGLDDPEYNKFKAFYDSFPAGCKSNIWILKPGECTNRG